MKIKLLLLFALLLGISTISIAQVPMAKVDINIAGRSETEVNEPGYTSWFMPSAATSSITVSGVVFTMKATGPGTTATFRTSWSKTLVQSPYYMRLVNDGVKVDNDTLLKYPGQPASFEMEISGLPVGTHTLQTYHNIWEDTTTVNYSPMNVYVDGVKTYSRVKRSVKVQTKAAATVIMNTLNVTQEGQVIKVRFEAVSDFTAFGGKTRDLNVNINAFELNTDDASKIANTPTPEDRFYHADADAGSLTLKWKDAVNGFTKFHSVYFGTDSTAIANATTTTASLFKGTFPVTTREYTVSDLYKLQNYFWRVDETDSAGLVTKGKVWQFKPRQLAFNGAEGYGRFAAGGRGGKVVYVTNLNSTGPGSFYDAVTNGSGPRTVLFNVSGYIDLPGRTMMNPNITIAGQTAPGKGVTLRYAPLGVNGESVIRYVRMRLGQTGNTYDGIGMAGANHSIMDHCSVSWTIDEAVSSRGAKNISMQRTLISEALNVAGHANYPAGTAHGYAGSMGGDVASLHHNLLAHNSGRNWSMAGGLDGSGYYSGRLDIFNMVVYNWGTRATDGGAMEVNFVNNYFKKGASTTQTIMLKADLEGTGKGSQSYYYAGNVEQNTNGTFQCDGTDNTCARTYTTSNGQVVDWDVFVNQPFFPSYATIESAKDAYKSVLSNVGANLPLDNHDVRIINETLTGTYTYKGSVTNKAGLIDHHDDCGGYEDMPAESRPTDFDTDMDGLPNWWENLHGTNPNSTAGDFSDANADTDKDGITNLDNYLEWMATPHYFIPSGQNDTIDLAPLTVAYTNNPVYSTSGNTTVNVHYLGSRAVVAIAANESGIKYFDFKVTDNQGSQTIRTIGIYAGIENPTAVNVVKAGKSNFNVYPTVFTNELTISGHATGAAKVIATVEDLYGRVSLSKELTMQEGMNTFQLKTPALLPTQFYLVKISQGASKEVIAVEKVMKK